MAESLDARDAIEISVDNSIVIAHQAGQLASHNASFFLEYLDNSRGR